MPIHAPVTAATTGLSISNSARMNCATGESAPCGGRCMKSSRSLPDVKTPGCPVISTARTAGSSAAARSASAIAWYIAAVSAFFFSGRAISMVATPFSVAVLMVMLSPGWSVATGGVSSRARRGLQHRSHALVHDVDRLQRAHHHLEVHHAARRVPPDKIDAVDGDAIELGLELEQRVLRTGDLAHVAAVLVAQHVERS